MICPYCSQDTSVTNSRLQKRNNRVWRRRQCKACGAVFTTHEAIDLSTALLVLKNGSSGPFLSDKLFASILECMVHRSDRYTAAREATNTVVRRVFTKQTSAAISSSDLAEITAKVLEALDKKSYLRYSANCLP